MFRFSKSALSTLLSEELKERRQKKIHTQSRPMAQMSVRLHFPEINDVDVNACFPKGPKKPGPNARLDVLHYGGLEHTSARYDCID